MEDEDEGKGDERDARLGKWTSDERQAGDDDDEAMPVSVDDKIPG